ncbi:DUF1559 family PulG-like putative transporter [Singulisphaera rosea]
MKIRTQRSSLAGFTLVELLTVVLVIAIVTALLIPAVQSAREAARRANCQHNLRQIGLGLSQYVTSFGVYPEGSNGLNYSLISMILPFMEERPLFNSINFSYPSSSAQSETAKASHISSLICPSEPPRGEGPGRTNYSGNGGYDLPNRGFNGLFAHPSIKHYVVGNAAILDGTSTTCAMSELVLGENEQLVLNGVVFKTEYLSDPEEFDLFLNECRDAVPPNAEFSSWTKPGIWIMAGFRYSLMNHNIAINGHSCLNGTSVDLGAWTAGSRHPSGANTLFADGHCSFVRDSMNVEIWHDLSTRNGGEVISDQQF